VAAVYRHVEGVVIMDALILAGRKLAARALAGARRDPKAVLSLAFVALAMVAAVVSGPAHLVGVNQADTIVFPTIDMTALSDNVSAFFAFLSPILWLVGGIAIGGYLLHKALGLMH
jgi:hypothetical protein